jgi:hypothetical protein
LSTWALEASWHAWSSVDRAMRKRRLHGLRSRGWAGVMKGFVARHRCWNGGSSLPVAKAEVRSGEQSRAATGEGACCPTWPRCRSECEECSGLLFGERWRRAVKLAAFLFAEVLRGWLHIRYTSPSLSTNPEGFCGGWESRTVSPNVWPLTASTASVYRGGPGRNSKRVEQRAGAGVEAR